MLGSDLLWQDRETCVCVKKRKLDIGAQGSRGDRAKTVHIQPAASQAPT